MFITKTFNWSTRAAARAAPSWMSLKALAYCVWKTLSTPRFSAKMKTGKTKQTPVGESRANRSPLRLPLLGLPGSLCRDQSSCSVSTSDCCEGCGRRRSGVRRWPKTVQYKRWASKPVSRVASGEQSLSRTAAKSHGSRRVVSNSKGKEFSTYSTAWSMICSKVMVMGSLTSATWSGGTSMFVRARRSGLCHGTICVPVDPGNGRSAAKGSTNLRFKFSNSRMPSSPHWMRTGSMSLRESSPRACRRMRSSSSTRVPLAPSEAAMSAICICSRT
mmetsp:Transcript_125061/g.314933  ORF Transcript_125061/g.314933 Transcript_125061/m.314933 type:complete len:274 (+) Transcript_125061:167-988(+)